MARPPRCPESLKRVVFKTFPDAVSTLEAKTYDPHADPDVVEDTIIAKRCVLRAGHLGDHYVLGDANCTRWESLD